MQKGMPMMNHGSARSGSAVYSMLLVISIFECGVFDMARCDMKQDAPVLDAHMRLTPSWHVPG